MQPSPVSAEGQVANRQRLVVIELQREKIRELERPVQQRKLDDAARQAEVERETFGISDLRGKVRELERRTRQRNLDDAAARRLEMQRVKEQQEAVRGKKSRLDSLATVERGRELWRLQDEQRREHKRLRDKAGIRARGVYKRPVAC